mmetsp:Transcript_23238/g.44244  ORF Transcript_23238/g.44244 Transcript_23238/m.44244 type:complete len:471 (-) Transcript_23238:234-1646(-)
MRLEVGSHVPGGNRARRVVGRQVHLLLHRNDSARRPPRFLELPFDQQNLDQYCKDGAERGAVVFSCSSDLLHNRQRVPAVLLRLVQLGPFRHLEQRTPRLRQGQGVLDTLLALQGLLQLEQNLLRDKHKRLQQPNHLKQQQIVLARLQHWALEDLAARLPRASLGEPRHQRLMHVRRNRETLRSARVPGQLPRLQQCHQVLGFLPGIGPIHPQIEVGPQVLVQTVHAKHHIVLPQLGSVDLQLAHVPGLVHSEPDGHEQVSVPVHQRLVKAVLHPRNLPPSLRPLHQLHRLPGAERLHEVHDLLRGAGDERSPHDVEHPRHGRLHLGLVPVPGLVLAQLLHQPLFTLEGHGQHHGRLDAAPLAHVAQHLVEAGLHLPRHSVQLPHALHHLPARARLPHLRARLEPVDPLNGAGHLLVRVRLPRRLLPDLVALFAAPCEHIHLLHKRVHQDVVVRRLWHGWRRGSHIARLS